MTPIDKKMWEQLVTIAKDEINGVAWQPIGKIKDGRQLCLVMGYEDGYDAGEQYQVTVGDTIFTLCAKLAINIDDLQCDYDMDWYMPWDKKTGDVWDTNMAVNGDQDIDWYNDEAKAIINEFYKGTIECE